MSRELCKNQCNSVGKTVLLSDRDLILLHNYNLCLLATWKMMKHKYICT